MCPAPPTALLDAFSPGGGFQDIHVLVSRDYFAGGLVDSMERYKSQSRSVGCRTRLAGGRVRPLARRNRCVSRRSGSIDPIFPFSAIWNENTKMDVARSLPSASLSSAPGALQPHSAGGRRTPSESSEARTRSPHFVAESPLPPAAHPPRSRSVRDVCARCQPNGNMAVALRALLFRVVLGRPLQSAVRPCEPEPGVSARPTWFGRWPGARSHSRGKGSLRRHRHSLPSNKKRVPAYRR